MSYLYMQNNIEIEGKIYKAQLYWRKNKSDKHKDINDTLFPFPKERKPWGMKESFLKRIKIIQNLIENKKPYDQIFIENKDKGNCLLCEKKKISTKIFILNEYLWRDDIVHYIKNHGAKPDKQFVDFIFDINLNDYFTTKLLGRLDTINETKKETSNINMQYLKLEKNQIMILDALMKHGGYSKKYYDVDNKKISRYSEHAGFLDTNNKIVYDIVVSGNTLRIDKGDEEIFLPGNMPRASNYHYIFHTHPPTPKPGGRANLGIIYELPSVGDILHFIDHYNSGKTIGSLVMAPEGIYNIRELNLNGKKISIDENIFYKEMQKEIWNINKDAFEQYGEKFSANAFYTEIAQNKKYIDAMNDKLKKHKIYVDYFPRTKDFKGKWIIDTIYVPIYEK